MIGIIIFAALNLTWNPGHATNQLYEGKSKHFEGPEPGTVVAYFKDDLPIWRVKPSAITGKGVVNNAISDFIMTRMKLASPT